jgi:hypothetical protein
LAESGHVPFDCERIIPVITIQLAPDFETQKQTIEVIATDIDLLLRGSLRKQDIREKRYADILGLELFGDF